MFLRWLLRVALIVLAFCVGIFGYGYLVLLITIGFRLEPMGVALGKLGFLIGLALAILVAAKTKSLTQRDAPGEPGI